MITALRGTVRVVSDKSLTHRGLILGALARGTSRLHRPNPGADCMATLRALRLLGIPIEEEGDGVRIEGGRERWRAPSEVLDLENSGTGLRLLAGALAGFPFESRLTGDASLRARPMARIITPLQALGARIESEPGGRAPLTIHGLSASELDAMAGESEHRLEIASAQVKSALLLAHSARRSGLVRVSEPFLSRDHTERLLAWQGAKLERDGSSVTLHLPAELRARDWEVPGDPSAAAFFWVGAAITPGSRVTVEGVGLNPTRVGALEVLRRMGARVEITPDRVDGPEPVGSVTVEFSSLTATVVEGEEVPRLLDEVPILAVAAARAHGTTWFRDVRELRVKESDRIRTTLALLRALGAETIEEDAAFAVTGPIDFQGAAITTAGDHRIAMSAMIAACAAREPVTVDSLEMVGTSDPSFVSTLRQLTLAT